jgi:hypothetical protein
MATWNAYLADTVHKGSDASTLEFTVFYYDSEDPANTAAGRGPAKNGTASASTNLITSTSHGYNAGDLVTVTAITGGAPLAVDGVYVVMATGLTANAFGVSRAPNGTVVDITADASAITVRRLVAPVNILHAKLISFPASRFTGLSANERRDFIINLVQIEGDSARDTKAKEAALAAQFPIGSTLTLT